MLKHEDLLPSFIESRSPKGLRVLMLKKNLEHQGMVKFFDIQTYTKRGKEMWIAWYYVRLNDNELIELLKDKRES